MPVSIMVSVTLILSCSTLIHVTKFNLIVLSFCTKYMLIFISISFIIYVMLNFYQFYCFPSFLSYCLFFYLYLLHQTYTAITNYLLFLFFLPSLFCVPLLGKSLLCVHPLWFLLNSYNV